MFLMCLIIIGLIAIAARQTYTFQEQLESIAIPVPLEDPKNHYYRKHRRYPK